MDNHFHYINKFPRTWGIIVFPISMSRISNAQSPQVCIEDLDMFLGKILENRVGVNFIYSEGLYMNFEDKAYETKNKFAHTEASHVRGVRNLVKKNYRKFQIDSAFHFDSWFQMYLMHHDFFEAFGRVCKFYEDDELFRKYIALDIANQGKDLLDKQVQFYLEEHTFVYLLLNLHLNLQLKLSNDFVNQREQWLLLSYPGNPPLGQIYLYQKDILNLNKNNINPYQGQYNSSTKKFIDYSEYVLPSF